MNGLNGIIISGKVYETVKGECNKQCAFWNDKECATWCDYCESFDCFFRFSQTLTDKINEK